MVYEKQKADPLRPPSFAPPRTNGGVQRNIKLISCQKTGFIKGAMCEKCKF